MGGGGGNGDTSCENETECQDDRAQVAGDVKGGESSSVAYVFAVSCPHLDDGNGDDDFELLRDCFDEGLSAWKLVNDYEDSGLEFEVEAPPFHAGICYKETVSQYIVPMAGLALVAWAFTKKAKKS